ncbi:hypothetical protein HNQ77_004548 [Silvibacterium bohemicum]|uniref:Bacterial Ig-like domain-containing protein n=1 Tax=Silvibacterium bohemicum TaxID=1577686 RepID=A0A841K3Q5_9BACT|nr:FG-GAP-like repeat-containing protein [Silvibacterium bohemicum]MBB6146569.1 hypothetical protein [Silvibacterium bohemicum]
MAAVASPTPAFAGFYAAPFYQTIFDPYEAGPVALLNGDFNHDGKPDLVSVTFLGGIAVLLNNGAGGFGDPIVSQISPATGGDPGAGIDAYNSAYAVDLNGDGYTDLVVPTSSFEVAVLLNHQDGTFPTTTYITLQNLNSSPAATRNGSVAQGKTTASGGVDLVSVQSFISTNTSQTTILVETFLNDGTGNFPAQKTSTYTVPILSTLETGSIATLADVNQDGKLDLLLVRDCVQGNPPWTFGNPLYVDVLLGNGDGTFQPPAAAGTISFAGSAAVFPFSSLTLANLVAGSSIPDIVLSNSSGIYVANGNGDGTFQTPTYLLQDYTFPSVQIADLNGDGKLDLVLGGAAGVTSFLGNGDGTFGGVTGAVVSGDGQMTIADFNGDGKIDLAAQNSENGDVEVAPGNGDGTFRATPVLFSTTTPILNPPDIDIQVAGDIAGNGTNWVIGLGNGMVLSGSPNGKEGFNYLNALPSVATYYTFWLFPVLGDFNGDGKQDLILAGNNNVAVALSNGDGTFATPVNVPLSVTPSCVILNVAVADVNRDGKLDLLIAYPGDFRCGIPNTVPSGYLVALGNGDGTFKTATFTPYGESLSELALAPYHGPGKPLDMVAEDEGLPPGSSSIVNPSVSLLPGNGDGTFGAPVTLFTDSQQGVSLRTDDYNQDGKPDLTLFDGSEIDADSGILLYAGNGDGTFAAPVLLSSVGGALAGTYADVNNDGVPDLIFTGYSGLSVALGTGGGSFAAPIANFAPELFGPVLTGSFLGDNTISVIISDGSHGATTFYMNEGGTSLSVVPNSTTLTAGQNLILNVPLQATLQNQPAPTGTITLYDGSTVLSSGSVSGFTFITTQLAVGGHTIKAVYSGDSHFYSNTSPTISISVNAVPPDFTLKTNPSSVTVSPGQSANVQMTVAANATLAGNLTFQCSGLPSKAACTFSPSTLSVASSQSGGVALTVSTQSTTVAQASFGSFPFIARCSIAALLLFGFPLRRRNLTRLLLLFCAVALSFTGCGSSSTIPAPPANAGTPAGTTTFTVAATVTSGNTMITHTSTITLVVQ